MHINGSSGSLYLNGNQTQTTQCETYLGIQRTADARNTTTAKENVKTGCHTANSPMEAGIYGLNGISLAISIALVDIYVTDAMMHSLEALILQKQYQILDNSYQNLLQQIQYLPQCTAMAVIYPLLDKSQLNVSNTSDYLLTSEI